MHRIDFFIVNVADLEYTKKKDNFMMTDAVLWYINKKEHKLLRECIQIIINVYLFFFGAKLNALHSPSSSQHYDSSH